MTIDLTALAKALRDDINLRSTMKLLDESSDPESRPYFGASQIKPMCDRQMFLDWRRATPMVTLSEDPEKRAEQIKKFGQLARLFGRGHREEPVTIDLLRPYFREIVTHEADGSQIAISNFAGHFRGHLDGIGYDFEFGDIKIPGPMLLEIKTANEKSFTGTSVKGLFKTKEEHYAQQQEYMYHKDIPRALYFVTCKNDDNIYPEFSELDTEYAESMMNRVVGVLSARSAPEKMEFGGRNNFYCKYFCDHTEVCLNNATPTVSCRTCSNFVIDGEDLRCRLHDIVLKNKVIAEACSDYQKVTIL